MWCVVMSLVSFGGFSLFDLFIVFGCYVVFGSVWYWLVVFVVCWFGMVWFVVVLCCLRLYC